jgi:hypothetical protein
LIFSYQTRKKCLKADEFFKSQISKEFLSSKLDSVIHGGLKNTKKQITTRQKKKEVKLKEDSMEEDEEDSTDEDVRDDMENTESSNEQSKETTVLSNNGKCHICYRRFKTSKGLRNHIYEDHEDQNFCCRQCGYLSRNRENHITHLKRHLRRK